MIISIKYLKLITTYSMLYDTCDYHILHYSKINHCPSHYYSTHSQSDI